MDNPVFIQVFLVPRSESPTAQTHLMGLTADGSLHISNAFNPDSIEHLTWTQVN